MRRLIWLMRIVSNTSPVSNLAIIDRLELLRAKYGAAHADLIKRIEAVR